MCAKAKGVKWPGESGRAGGGEAVSRDKGLSRAGGSSREAGGTLKGQQIIRKLRFPASTHGFVLSFIYLPIFTAHLPYRQGMWVEMGVNEEHKTVLHLASQGPGVELRARE